MLIIDKPPGPTSFDVVHMVRAALKVKKVGHTGTLDPMATGLLPICLGDATKIAGYITQGDKAYTANIKLGAETDTQDAQGKVLRQAPVPPLTRAVLEDALAAFRGPLLQVPPMYSAVKIDGKRLYELARAGEEVERQPRPVTVHALDLLDFTPDSLTVQVRCSKGFFVRTLAFDLGRRLGCGAHLAALRRTHSGSFSLAQALPLQTLLERVAAQAWGEISSRLVSPNDALAEMPPLSLPGPLAAKVRHGVAMDPPADTPVGRIRVLDGGSGELLAIAEVTPERRLKYLRVLVS